VSPVGRPLESQFPILLPSRGHGCSVFRLIRETHSSHTPMRYRGSKLIRTQSSRTSMRKRSPKTKGFRPYGCPNRCEQTWILTHGSNPSTMKHGPNTESKDNLSCVLFLQQSPLPSSHWVRFPGSHFGFRLTRGGQDDKFQEDEAGAGTQNRNWLFRDQTTFQQHSFVSSCSLCVLHGFAPDFHNLITHTHTHLLDNIATALDFMFLLPYSFLWPGMAMYLGVTATKPTSLS